MSRSEPKVRKDERCVVCDLPIETKPRPGLPLHLYHDPFCSSVCAKTFYGVTIPPGPVKK